MTPLPGRGSPVEPGYLELYRTGELHRRAALALEKLHSCNLCARYCGADRTDPGCKTACRSGRFAELADNAAITTIESPLGGARGSGIIRFAGCNLDCQYCRNWHSGSPVRSNPVLNSWGLATLMLDRQTSGYININLAPASHLTAQILEALLIACEKGLRIPLVFNSGGYDSLESLELLDGVVDIYAIEVKYGNNVQAEKYSCTRNYVEYSHIAVREMHRQVGDLIIDDDSIARRGLIVRHLVLPANQAATRKVLSFISSDISPDTYINLLDGYRPHHNAGQFEKLDRPVTETEVLQAIRYGDRCGLHRLDLYTNRAWIGI